MENIKLTRLPSEEWKILKIIRIETEIGFNLISGDLPYTRRFTDTYNLKNYEDGDDLDAIILKSVTEFFPKSRLKLSKAILFEGDLNNGLSRIHKGSEQEITFIFQPIPQDIPTLINEGFHYNLDFKIHWLHDEKEKKHQIIPYIQCPIPPESIDVLIQTISPI